MTPHNPTVTDAENDFQRMVYCENYIGKDPQFDDWESLHDPDAFLIRKLKCILSTEHEMHKAWRKRAEEAESTALKNAEDVEGLQSDIDSTRLQLVIANEYLTRIQNDDKAESHPCGPQKYGHFGELAIAAFKRMNEALTKHRKGGVE